jgi:hypothetical protein
MRKQAANIASQLIVCSALVVEVNTIKITEKGIKIETRRFFRDEIIKPPIVILLMMVYIWDREEKVLF